MKLTNPKTEVENLFLFLFTNNFSLNGSRNYQLRFFVNYEFMSTILLEHDYQARVTSSIFKAKVAYIFVVIHEVFATHNNLKCY